MTNTHVTATHSQLFTRMESWSAKVLKGSSTRSLPARHVHQAWMSTDLFKSWKMTLNV